jgi:hypothetical protein
MKKIYSAPVLKGITGFVAVLRIGQANPFPATSESNKREGAEDLVVPSRALVRTTQSRSSCSTTSR